VLIQRAAAFPFGTAAAVYRYIILQPLGAGLLQTAVIAGYYRGVDKIVIHEYVDSAAYYIAVSDYISEAGLVVTVGIPAVLQVAADKYA